MTTLLLVFAMGLGLLAFFEPCTIATNTLFSVRAHRDDRHCCQSLVTVWLVRCLLMGSLLTIAVMISQPPQWGPWLPSIILTAMAVLYLVSRYIYIPAPHLEFHRFTPGHQKLPHALQLGLTLPACTLPLVIIIVGMAITVDSVPLAMLAGILFASLFTLPMVVSSITGVHEDGRELLNRAATGTPWLTAALLLGTALFLLIPSLDVSAQTLKAVLSEASWAGIGIAFLAGFIFSFNPVSFAAIPVMLAYVTKAHEEKRALLLGAAFVAGLILTHVTLGIAAALGGEWVKDILGRQWALLLGPLLILLGLMWPGWLTIRLPWFGLRGKPATGLWGAFLLGIPFSVAICPFCTPALLVALTSSAAIGSVGFGFGLLLAFALGRSIPIMLGAWSMGWLESLHMLSKHQKALEITAGIVLILTGLYLLNEYFFIVKY
ncbi:MAG: cytochrome c biogenesis CcdA family protein [Arenicellales bacterium]